MAKNYSKVSLKVQKKSGFDKSFQNLFTGKVGTIIPILTDELIPNSTVHLKAAITASLPPLASDTFMRCKLKYAAFFCPTRLLFKGFEKWLTNDLDLTSTYIAIPKLVLPNTIWQNDTTDKVEKRLEYIGPGSLADYLGCKVTRSYISNSKKETRTDLNLNALPFMAYHRIYNDWFRNALVQKDIYKDEYKGYDGKGFTISTSQYVCPDAVAAKMKFGEDSEKFEDGVYLHQLRQANFGYDVFTTASPQAQSGTGQSVGVELGDQSNGSFTIAALRAANSLQLFQERNAICGPRLVDYVKAHYGANLSDGVAQRPILLGKGSFDMYSKGIYQTTPNNVDNSYDSQNPFGSVGAKYGNAYADGTDTLVDSFTAMEPGYLMVLCWLSPKVTYSTGLDPILYRYDENSPTDMANPLLQNTGNEPIPQVILDGSQMAENTNRANVFGYTERYAFWKDKFDEVHGILRDGSPLESFALQRTFDDRANRPTISTNFLQIPINYLDQVAAVAGTISDYGYWADTYFDYKVSMPLAEYSIPSLQDPAYEHGETVSVNKSGTNLS